ncbi:exonuclease domain-containing protein [Polaribacter sp.]|uniref:exonuclease domain-containing protein n=1 Tax=Polaribacter sp. TaxID=1920175 RepID=UPI003EF5EB6F
MYAILDIETTGGKFNEEGITEIAIYKFDGHDTIDQFISLVNPEKPIQEFVVRLTGINNKMLKNAPKFYEIAKRIIEITSDCILVAHNTAFDYRILSTEFDRLGYDFNRNTLCTVELSQKLILDQPSYSLGKLIKSLGIPMTDRHRASGDALATVQLFKLLLEKDVNKEIFQNSIKYFDRRRQKQKLRSLIDEIPAIQGLYYIHDSDGKVIYLGKGKNIKAEINRLFLKVTKRAVKIQDKSSTISFDVSGNELFTRLKYAIEIEALSPKFNFRKKEKPTILDFNNDNFLIIDKGREVEENAIILIEDSEVFGYGYTNLNYQENRLDILKKVLTPIKNKQAAKTIIKRYLNNYKVQKIIRL